MLLRFKDIHNNIIYINPQLVEAVVPRIGNVGIVMTSSAWYRVNGDLDEIAQTIATAQKTPGTRA